MNAHDYANGVTTIEFRSGTSRNRRQFSPAIFHAIIVDAFEAGRKAAAAAKVPSVSFKPAKAPADAPRILMQRVEAMLRDPGLYIAGDVLFPQAIVPLWVNGGRAYSMKVDEELAPDRFLETLTLAGPYLPNSVSKPNQK